MDTIEQRIVICPVCASYGTMLHHDLRALLVYSCQNCLHEWQIAPADEPRQEDQANGPPPTAQRAP
jgi:hypothetical protein